MEAEIKIPFTKGVWILDEDENSPNYGRIYADNDYSEDFDWMVADVGMDMDFPIPKEERMANARLFECSPEILKQLIEAYKFIKQSGNEPSEFWLEETKFWIEAVLQTKID